MEVRLIGEGSVEWTFELPLTEVFADQVRKGSLRPADDESAAAVASILVEAEEEAELEAAVEEEPIVDEPDPEEEPDDEEPEGDAEPDDDEPDDPGEGEEGDGDPAEEKPEAPPVTGRGSSTEAWVAYAKAIGLDPEGMTRAEIIKAAEAA